MTTRRLLCALLLAVPLALPTAAAEDAPAAFTPSSSVVLKLGAVIPQSSDLDSFDTGPAFDLSYGYRLHPNFALEGSVGYFSLKASATAGADSASITESVIPVLVTAKGIFPAGRIDLYALAGIGAYFVSTDAKATLGGIPFSASTSNTSFGFHLGAGVSAELWPQFGLGAEVRYFTQAAADLEGETISLDSLTVQVTGTYRF